MKGTPSAARQLQDSAESVTVVDARKARQQSADLGEVLARTQGIGIRREGGLGSGATLTLNGLQGDQIRLFLDGVPLELAGYPFGIVNVPVNLIERIEVYRGVVPLRFGADALGGAVNLVTNPQYETALATSYQIGSFGLHRFSMNGRYRHEPSGFVAGVSGFLDVAKNDFDMADRPLATPDGGTELATLPRFHDRYQAFGANVEVGVVEKPWARRLLLQGFYTTFDKDLQHNALMSVPYGEVTYGQTTYGATARYEVDLDPRWSLELLANFSHRTFDFRDMSTTVYKWTGERGRAVGREGQRGEIRGEAIDESIYEYGWFGRAGLTWKASDVHTLRASVTPRFIRRTGEDHVPGRVDLLGLKDGIAQLVGGVEAEQTLFGERLSNIAFVKGYYQRATHQERTMNTDMPRILNVATDSVHGGAGDSLRYRFTTWVLGKVSYEYAIRLPNADELFGNGVLVDPNTKLRPERSHNVNVGPRFEVERTRYGTFVFDINGFLRETTDQIILLAGRQFTPYTNIGNARTLGVENTTSWSAPKRWLTLDGTLTYNDSRNTSTTGAFADFEGMRIPSRPYLFGSWGARLRFPGLPGTGALEPFYYGRYTHGFDRGWAIGAEEYRISLPAQVNHDAGVTYTSSPSFGSFTTTFEVQNLANAQLFDVFGVQRPGRSFHLKLTAQL